MSVRAVDNSFAPSGLSPANNVALSLQAFPGKVRWAWAKVTGRKSPKPNQGWVPRDWPAMRRRETKLAAAGTWAMLARRSSHGAWPSAFGSAGPVSSRPNGMDSSGPVGATTNVFAPSSREATPPKAAS